uniref:Uncharacterized protein LOC105120503 isoform X2 n=1 Tax=Rhizophora mucronata TaxID=61149 RepID=A0A2P2L798_RHIMU
MIASFPTNFSGVLLFPFIITFSFTEKGYCTPLCKPSAAAMSPFS